MQQLLDQTIGDRRARLITLIVLAALVAVLMLAPTSSAREGANNRVAGYVAGGLFVLVLIFSIVAEIRNWPYTRANMTAARRARAALKTGRALPIPPLPEKLSKLQRDRQHTVENYARQLIGVPWGERVTLTGSQLRPVFDETVAFVRRVPGDWSKFAEPVRIFASMPAPWCFIGAAEIMQRLSFYVGSAFSPAGLRQGLRFIAQAQAADPDNADALVTRARLLTSTSDPRWLRLAEDTLRRAQAIAPNHPRLPGAEATLFQRYGQQEKALACIEQAIARAPTPTDQVIARTTYANALLNMGRDEEAVAAYRTLLQTEEQDPWLWHNLSIALYDLQRYDEALASNQRALSIMPFGAAFARGDLIRKKLASAQGGSQP